MLECYLVLLCTSLSLVRPTGKNSPFVNYALLCAGIMSVDHNEYKIMNVLSYGTKMIKISV